MPGDERVEDRQLSRGAVAAANPSWPRFRVGVNSGEVVIGEGTRNELPEDVVVEQLPPLELEGKAAPVTAYLRRGLP